MKSEFLKAASTGSNITPIKYFVFFSYIDMHQTWPTKAKRHSNINYDATHVIKHFFHLFGKWKWPEPVALIEVNPRHKWLQHQIEQLEKNAAITSWNPGKNFTENFQVCRLYTFFDKFQNF